MTADPIHAAAQMGDLEIARSVENDARWGLTWVGGTLFYTTQEDAEQAQRLYVSGSIIPPASSDEGSNR